MKIKYIIEEGHGEVDVKTKAEGYKMVHELAKMNIHIVVVEDEA